MRLRYVEEPEPRGTAGALKYAEDLLDDRFLMLNGDVLTDMDLTAQIAQHEATGARATLALVPVADPSAYGLVRTHADGAVKEFVEKPGADQIDTNLISAGAYVLERSVVDMIEPDRNVSIERKIWPALVGNGLYAYAHEAAYWLDIGTPRTYLRATFDILDGNVKTNSVQRLGEGLAIDPGARIGALVVLGDGVKVGAGSRLDRAVVLERHRDRPRLRDRRLHHQRWRAHRRRRRDQRRRHGRAGRRRRRGQHADQRDQGVPRNDTRRRRGEF